MEKYVALRKEVCAGSLLQTQRISYVVNDENGSKLSRYDLHRNGINNIEVFGGLVCRGMLFKVNENGLSDDLIYTTPTNYLIRGINPNINIETDFIINNYVELNDLLKYLKYGEYLTQNDLNNIYRKLIINNNWLNNHHELFGWKKVSYNSYSSGGVETIPMSIYDNLSTISCSKNGKPYLKEPEHSLIKKRKF